MDGEISVPYLVCLHGCSAAVILPLRQYLLASIHLFLVVLAANAVRAVPPCCGNKALPQQSGRAIRGLAKRSVCCGNSTRKILLRTHYYP